jgi:tellurite methyltransferase
MPSSIDFFDQQFRSAPAEALRTLNPFEEQVLPHLRGEVLDFGCGVGNLAFAAAAQGCRVTALDGSAAAIAHVRARAAAEGAAVQATQADLRQHPLPGSFDCVVSIGLLMFFDCPDMERVLADLQARVRPGGFAAINLLVEGTTFLDMFDPASQCLWPADELKKRFSGWDLLLSETREFNGPRNTLKRFATVMARKPMR